MVFVLAGATDGLDGFIARRFDLRTRLGAVLDPIADKLMLMSAFLALALGPCPLPVPAWLTALVVLRNLLLLAASGVVLLVSAQRSSPRARPFEPSLAGKATTVAQLGFVTLALLENARGERSALFAPLVVVMVTLSLGSALHYLVREVPAPRRSSSPPP